MKDLKVLSNLWEEEEEEVEDTSSLDGGVAPQTISIDGQELSLDEARQLIETGRKTRDYESKYNTKLDRVWPEYGRISQEHKRLSEEHQKAVQSLQIYEQKKDQGTETNQDLARAREAARQLGITFKEDLEKDGYVRRDDVTKMVEDLLSQKESVQTILSRAKGLESEIDGSDGRPRFNARQVLAYQQAYNIEDPMQAYEDMFDVELKRWKESKLGEKTNTAPLKTISGRSTTKEPGAVRISDNNLADALADELG